MSIKRVLFLILFFFTVSFLTPRISQAFDLKEALTSENSIIVKVQEGIEYFFAFRIENKIQVLDKHADKRLVMAREYANDGNNERVQSLVRNYEQIKERQNNLLGKVDDKEVLGMVEERIIEQQKTMEEIKTGINNDTRQEVVRVQEQVVNQVAKRVIDVNGTEGTTEFLNEVLHVWAPGTGPGGGEAGVVYAGGGKLIYAPGTSAGGQGGVVIEGGEMKFATGASMDSPGANIKNVEIITGGTINEPVPVGGDMNITTDTNLNGPVNVIDDTYDDNNQTIDP
jgi:hypothetical protein